MAKSKGKNTKKNNKKKEINPIETVGSFDTDITKKVLIVVIILVFIGLFYLLTLYITNKHSAESGLQDNTKDVVEESSISYDEIMVGRSLSMPEDEYLVVYYDFSNDEIASEYNSLVLTYRANDKNMPLYTVDMSNSFNSAYSTDKASNKNPSKVADFKIVGPTLIKVSKGKVVKYIEGEEVSEYLK